ncbi:MAG TPA: cation:proton antiporter [Solirubrobacteraceae bacterium]|nr:cation:proton antiporter [Solirubrobacteraceae bacterium]
MVAVDELSFLVIVGIAALAGLTTTLLAPRVAAPVVVVELALGIVVGPQVLDLAQLDDFTRFLGSLGLGMLFFFAGYEIDFARIRGRPLALAGLGWALSLALAYAVGGVLALAGVVLSLLYTGSALATTAIGTLIPILRDAGELRTRFAPYLLAAGALGEFGPILLITLVLAGSQPLHEAAILTLFAAAALATGVFAVRGATRGWPLLERAMETSSQLAVRLALALVFGLVALASELGLELLLGGFVAGLIVRQSLGEREAGGFESKLAAVGYGLLIPFFFVTSGMAFDGEALTSSAPALLELPLFLALFLVVRGVPALLLYRRELPALRDRAALGLYCATELPLVVAITTLAVEQGDMRASTAAALVGASMVSTVVFPLVALALRRPARAAAG